MTVRTPRPDPGLLDRVRQRLLADDVGSPRTAQVARALRDEGLVMGDTGLMSLVSAVRDELAGLGPLQSLAGDPRVTDILVNGPGSVIVDRGEGLTASDVVFADDAAVLRLAQRLAASAGRRLDESVPFVDARLPEGIRLHAVIPPISLQGTTISLRIPRRRAFHIDELTSSGTICGFAAEWLRLVIRARLSFLVTGSTGSGKTTVLATMLGLIDQGERLLVVEDSAELRPEHPHVVRLEARPANLEGAGAVTLRDLVRQALRMRPDRLIVGEVRGAEVVDLLSALNTGHEGGCGTVHANSPEDVPARLEALGLMAGLPRDALHALVGAGLEAVIHLERHGAGTRRMTGLHLLRQGRRHTTAIPALLRDGDRLVPGPAYPDLCARVLRSGCTPPLAGA